MRRLALVAVAGGVLATSGSGQSQDGLVGQRYSLVQSNGALIATFAEFQGLTAEITPTDYYATDGSISFQRYPGKQRLPELTLERGMTLGAELWKWHESARNADLSL